MWVKAREDALEPLTPHEARHSAASYMAAAGLIPKEAQEAMGRADIRTTLNIYAKAVPGWQEQAASPRASSRGHRRRRAVPPASRRRRAAALRLAPEPS
jgi:integrase